MNAQIDYATLVFEIGQRLAKRETGTMFLKADDGHAYAVAFQNGTIAGVSSGLIVGSSAVEKLRSIKHASYRFNSSVFTPSGSKPDPLHVSLLLGTDGATPSDEREVVPGGNDLVFHKRAVVVIERRLLDVLGPFATHLLDDTLNSPSYGSIGANNLHQVLSTLAAEIDDREQSEQFIQSTLSELEVDRSS